MEIRPLKGKYVVAVSGGVDSVVLLDLLQEQSLKNHNLELVVAHFDHGIRPESAEDRKFVKELSAKYKLQFFFAEGKLGPKVSEQAARDARYKFLNDIVKKQSATGLITAHHQDDQLETAILNIIRGTGRKGLASLNSSKKLLRPLLDYPKSAILKYSKEHNLSWQEDYTNQDLKYLRNYIRHRIVPQLRPSDQAKLIDLIKRQATLNDEIDHQLASVLRLKSLDNQLPRLWLNSVDDSLSRELLAAWLRQNGLAEFDRKAINRLATETKTAHSNKRIDVYNGWQIVPGKSSLALERVER